MRPLVLTGMMGAGKTSIAAELGRVLARRVVDLDEEIVRRSSRSVDELFRELGEPEFRRLEVETYLQLNATGFQVLALGGGAFMSEVLRDAIEAAGTASVYLHAPVDELVRRLAPERSQRPLLASDDWESQLSAMYEARDPVYRLADVVVETEAKRIPDVAREVIDALPV